MQAIETKKRYDSNLARKHGIHLVTIHKWKREMSKEANKDSIDVTGTF